MGLFDLFRKKEKTNLMEPMIEKISASDKNSSVSSCNNNEEEYKVSRLRNISKANWEEYGFYMPGDTINLVDEGYETLGCGGALGYQRITCTLCVADDYYYFLPAYENVKYPFGFLQINLMKRLKVFSGQKYNIVRKI